MPRAFDGVLWAASGSPRGLTEVEGANGETSTITYDAYSRLDEVTSPHGAVTEYEYTVSPPKKRAILRFEDDEGVAQARFTETHYDGLGRIGMGTPAGRGRC